MENPMETEEAPSENVDDSTKEPVSSISEAKNKDSTLSKMDLLINDDSLLEKQSLAKANLGGSDAVHLSAEDCEQASENSLPTTLTSDISDPVVTEQGLSVADNHFPCSKYVEYTLKSNLQSIEGVESNTVTAEFGNENSNESSRIICFVNQDAKVTPSPVIQYVLDIDQYFDTVISCADGKIGAHRLVLASASPFIGDMFCSHDHRLGEVAVLVLPDVKVAVMKVLLNFCYTGSMYFPKEDETEVLDTMRLLLLGEFGDLSLKEVTVKVQPLASSPVETTENQQPEIEQAQENPSSVPGTSSSVPHSGSLDDLLTTTSSEDEEEDESDDSQSECGKSGKCETDDEKERLAFANNFLRHKKQNGSSKETAINYLIGPKVPGCKTKKLQCYHCPGAFKSVETLTTHLDNNHGIFLQKKKLKKSEFDTLTNCNTCSSNKHKEVSSANNCISKRSKTRCFICFGIIRIREFEHHIKSTHALEQRDGMCIVKCRWCEAGFLLQDPIDNKAMSAHCFSNHLPGLKNGHGSLDFDFETNETEDMTEVKMEVGLEPSPTVKNPNHTKLASIFTSIPSSGNKHSKLKMEASTSTLASPKTTSSNVAGTNQVPEVLALLRKASQKRKLVPEAESDSDLQNKNPKKKIRLDENGKRMQVAKRTGKPIGRLVHIEKLKSGVPRVTSTSQKGKSKSKSVLIDVTKLPEIYVNFQYSKSFVLEKISHFKESSCLETSDTKLVSNFPSVSAQSTEKNIDVGTLDVGLRDAEIRLSDSRCSMPCL